MDTLFPELRREAPLDAVREKMKGASATTWRGRLTVLDCCGCV